MNGPATVVALTLTAVAAIWMLWEINGPRHTTPRAVTAIVLALGLLTLVAIAVLA